MPGKTGTGEQKHLLLLYFCIRSSCFIYLFNLQTYGMYGFVLDVWAPHPVFLERVDA